MEFDKNWQYVCFLSIFDHWLTEKEARDCNIMFYGLAKKHGLLEQYFIGEQNFIQFYQSLDNQVIDLKKENSMILTMQSARFLQTLKSGLREQTHFKFYFPNVDIQAESNFDRTDILFAKDLESVRLLENLAKQHQLFIIETRSYNEFEKANRG